MLGAGARAAVAVASVAVGEPWLRVSALSFASAFASSSIA